MKRILVVDDDPGICEILEIRLKSEGYEVETAQNGVVAFVKANDAKPDLIILDVSMPTMDGLKFVQATRWLEMKDIPILILSALPRTKEIFHDLGVTHFMTKPYDSNKLLEEVSHCISN